MSPILRVVVCVMVVMMAACAGAPKSLTPVADAVFDDPTNIPADAAFAMRAMLAHMQGADLRGASFSPEAHHELSNHGYTYEGFSVGPHRLIRYEALDAAALETGRKALGLVGLVDAYGRHARLAYDLEYTLAEGTLRVVDATATAVYPHNPAIRVFLIPKNKLPEPAANWRDAYEAARALNVMPPGGLDDTRPLDTHALVLFVMDRTAPGTDLRLSLDIPELRRVLPLVELTHTDYRDYHGWRVAVVSIPPEMQAVHFDSAYRICRAGGWLQ